MRRTALAFMLTAALASAETQPTRWNTSSAGPGGTLPEGTVTGAPLTWDDVAAEWAMAAGITIVAGALDATGATHSFGDVNGVESGIIIRDLLGSARLGMIAGSLTIDNGAAGATALNVTGTLVTSGGTSVAIDGTVGDPAFEVGALAGSGFYLTGGGMAISDSGANAGTFTSTMATLPGGSTVATFDVNTPGTLTIADSGDGNPATSSSTPTSSIMAVTCSDTHSCEHTLGETAIANGTPLTYTNVGTNRLVLIHSAGVAELYGASRQTLMGGASVTLWYDADRWTQTGPVIEITDGIKTLTSADSPYSLLYTDKVLICNTTGGDIEVDITAAAAFDQTRVLSVLKTVAGNSLILDPNSTENLNGTSTSTTITAALDGMSIKSDGTDLWGF